MAIVLIFIVFLWPFIAISPGACEVLLAIPSFRGVQHQTHRASLLPNHFSMATTFSVSSPISWAAAESVCCHSWSQERSVYQEEDITKLAQCLHLNLCYPNLGMNCIVEQSAFFSKRGTRQSGIYPVTVSNSICLSTSPFDLEIGFNCFLRMLCLDILISGSLF